MRKVLYLFLVSFVSLALAACGGSPQHAGQRVYHTPQGVSAHSPTFGLPPKGGLKLVPPSSVPTVEMFDAVSLSQIPANPFAVAGYTAGFWPTYIPLTKAFPRAHPVSIAISWGYRARCLDIEPGDAVPAQAAPWVKADIKAGFKKPCIYASLSTMSQVRANLAANGIARTSVFLWDANWTFRQHLDAGYDATQWNDRAYGRNLDESTVTLAFLGVNPKPKPKPLPICIHHRLTKANCSAAKAKIASDNKAVAASRRALKRARQDVSGNHCVRPYRRGVCIHRGRDVRTFIHRIKYFTTQADAIASSH